MILRVRINNNNGSDIHITNYIFKVKYINLHLFFRSIKINAMKTKWMIKIYIKISKICFKMLLGVCLLIFIQAVSWGAWKFVFIVKINELKATDWYCKQFYDLPSWYVVNTLYDFLNVLMRNFKFFFWQDEKSWFYSYRSNKEFELFHFKNSRYMYFTRILNLYILRRIYFNIAQEKKMKKKKKCWSKDKFGSI